ncbi:tRNA (adenine(58)-N(1))-methyltransferase non-catalytic subunit TRM6, putative [Plasmodium chabaudi chabaudi]|uniref:tRNA (adenine(58)-N(1))-methyltransferase non-catalytic subunit TRM6 n=1 Tax=Plasmodium chabaudi chabaudi TaxID=31271 RepID=A0A4V0K6S7_PLACU|nr:tRNA (adenine(58)-N(1))-methyltransferase non-catalytic subunit TRM6, putative [Plasmodium chabaudi chabaudi]VTZ68348.1 tRNA (adenine(58)-N(1))-methyltransferase non-catalytic subunit TRM6, putative [Plasmodium chabaudi chabaudi]|eukprot:XP_746234.1 tRNA (adenine(58)-N(1))-methyltransferase non-catalytic subunit TRM6, putative [Plasmodium chabaudi chabaudi]
MKIKKHDFVLIDDDLKCRLHKVADMKIKIKKNYINLMFLVNKKYGSTFSYINNKWVRIKKQKHKLDIDYDEDITGTNKDIYHNNNSQKLTEENIAEIKEMNYENPYEIVQKLVDNSATYNEKTVISQFKYIQKKLKRHLCQFTVYECNIFNLANFYYKYFPEKISYIRVDYLANLLFHLNRSVLVKSGNNQMLLHNENSKNCGNDTNPALCNNAGETSIETKTEGGTEKVVDNISFDKHNIIIYDDSHGLLTSVINIVYDYNVNIVSLVHKNTCGSIIPSFGIRKNTSIAKVKILDPPNDTRTSKHIYLDENLNIVFPNVVENNEFINQSDKNGAINTFDNVETNFDESKRKEQELITALGSELKKEETADEVKSNVTENSQKRKVEQIYNNDININETVKKAHYTNDHIKKKINEDEMKEKNNLFIEINKMKKNIINDINMRKAESFVIIISSEFIYNTNTDINLLAKTLISISLKYLNNDNKIIIHTDDFNISNIFMQLLINSKSYINIKLNEFILREHQVIKRRTHPAIKNAKLGDGFLLTALKVESW